MNSAGSMPFSEGEPPSQIAYLRHISDGNEATSEDIRRSDSADDSATLEELDAYRRAENRHQDPPARERPAVGEAWPYRESLSFTRSLIFYGAGAVTHEHERACAAIQESRKLRQK
jgi:hypothetical protein